jgi:uncharacterized RDD family membrane protein YckC
MAQCLIIGIAGTSPAMTKRGGHKFCACHGAPYQSPVFAVPLAPPGAKRHFVCEEAYMPDGGQRQTSYGIDIKPHAYDPFSNPEYFEGVLARRMIAFLIDLVIITIPIILACIFIFLFGLITFGLGFALFFLVLPGSVIWALLYCGATMGGPASATVGMRTVDIEVRTWYGAPCYFLLGAVHAVAFWVTTSALTPLVLLVGLLNERRRLLHDFLLGTVVINNEQRRLSLRRYSLPDISTRPQ